MLIHRYAIFLAYWKDKRIAKRFSCILLIGLWIKTQGRNKIFCGLLSRMRHCVQADGEQVEIFNLKHVMSKMYSGRLSFSFLHRRKQISNLLAPHSITGNTNYMTHPQQQSLRTSPLEQAKDDWSLSQWSFHDQNSYDSLTDADREEGKRRRVRRRN